MHRDQPVSSSIDRARNRRLADPRIRVIQMRKRKDPPAWRVPAMRTAKLPVTVSVLARAKTPAYAPDRHGGDHDNASENKHVQSSGCLPVSYGFNITAHACARGVAGRREWNTWSNSRETIAVGRLGFLGGRRYNVVQTLKGTRHIIPLPLPVPPVPEEGADVVPSG